MGDKELYVLQNKEVERLTEKYNKSFLDCEDFDCDLSGWITKNITVCAGMFEGCKNFKHDLSNWKIHSTVYNRRNMFKNCKIPKKYMPEFIKL